MNSHLFSIQLFSIVTALAVWAVSKAFIHGSASADLQIGSLFIPVFAPFFVRSPLSVWRRISASVVGLMALIACGLVLDFILFGDAL